MIKWIVLVFGVANLFQQVKSEDTTYDNHTLIRLNPTKEEHLEAINNINDPELEFLKRSRGLNDTTDILVPPTRRKALLDFAQHNHLNLQIKQEHYGRSFERPEERVSRRRFQTFNLFSYNSYSAILQYIETLATTYPWLVTLENLGNSYEGRRMKLVKISSDPSKENPIIFIDAGVHAREWVAPAMALYIISRLTTDREVQKKILTGVDWYILPVVNPDGYEFTRSSKANRLWRKTRSRTAFEGCYGVDGNRNYGYKWGVSGVSTNPCDKETFAGQAPFTEPETQMVRNIMMRNAKRLKLYVSLHSYGNYLVYPWGYTGDVLPKEWQKLDIMARLVSEAIQRAGGQPLKVMSAGKWYPAAGGSDDYAFGAVGVPYSYTMELTDNHEFKFPEYLLRVALPQFFQGFKAFGWQIRREFSNVRMEKSDSVDTNEDED